MPRRAVRSVLALAAAASVALTGCATVVNGTPGAVVASNSNLTVVGDSGSSLDTTIKNALTDVFGFWQHNFPSVSGGKSFPALKGGLYSIDGADVIRSGGVSGPAAKEGCVQSDPSFIIDNAAYCRVDDSVVWDRSPQHL